MAKPKKKALALKKKKPAIKAKSKIVKIKPKKKKVLAIPKGYHSITAYLIVDGGAQALEFYKKAFGAKKGISLEGNGKIMHAEITIGDSKIMVSDGCSDMGARDPKHFGGSPVTMHLYVKDVDAMIKRALAAGATLLRPVEDMFYGDRAGEIQDPFGHRWHIATHVEDLTTAQIKKRAAALFAPKTA